jgi:endonuclease/exonuclease/phosphatase family metal-dependent hydrolase
MRLILYNVRYGTGTGLSYHVPAPFSGNFRRSTGRFKRITDYLMNLSPDIIGLVEVDGGSYRHEGNCQAETAASSMGGHHRFAVKYGERISRLPVLRSQGNAIISRLAPIKTDCHDLGRGMKRNALEVVYGDFSLVLVHLSLGSRSRRHQIRALRDLCSARERPLILAGDYNTLSGPEELTPLKETGMASVNELGLPTYPCRRPRKELDFVLISEEISTKGFSIPDVRFSDHLPLVCDLKISH